MPRKRDRSFLYMAAIAVAALVFFALLMPETGDTAGDALARRRVAAA